MQQYNNVMVTYSEFCIDKCITNIVDFPRCLSHLFCKLEFPFNCHHGIYIRSNNFNNHKNGIQYKETRDGPSLFVNKVNLEDSTDLGSLFSRQLRIKTYVLKFLRRTR